MSSLELEAPSVKHSRTHRRRKPMLNVDLNVALPVRDQGMEVTSMQTDVQQPNCQGEGGRSRIPPAPIDLEAFDDDVIISSPRAFAEAKRNSRRNHGRIIVVDLDSEDQRSWVTPKNRTKRRRVDLKQTTRDCDLSIIREGNSSSLKDNVDSVAPPDPPPKEPTFSCPICMGRLVEEMSTKCGHIFCKVCIKAAVAVQRKCPTCRRKVTLRDLIRVYLPAAS